MNNNIPTADELFDAYFKSKTMTGAQLGAVKSAMIEFAKFHVEAALKAACKYSKTSEIMGVIGVDEDSILNAYPLENIK